MTIKVIKKAKGLTISGVAELSLPDSTDNIDDIIKKAVDDVGKNFKIKNYDETFFTMKSIKYLNGKIKITGSMAKIDKELLNNSKDYKLFVRFVLSSYVMKGHGVMGIKSLNINEILLLKE